MDFLLEAIEVFTYRILPILLVIGLGVLMGRLYYLDIGTLSKINLHVLVPALVFSRLIRVPLSGAELFWIAAAVILNSFLLCLLMFVMTLNLRKEPATRMAAVVGATWGNSGNFGLPVMELMFGSLGAGVQAVVHAVTNVLAFSFGFYLLGLSQRPSFESAKMVLHMPSLYAAGLAIAFRAVNFLPPSPIMISIDYLAGGLIPIALLILGLQLSQEHTLPHIYHLTVATLVRLILGPAVMAGIVLFLPISRQISPILIVGAGVPAAVNSVALAIEAGSDAAFCAALVMTTTLLAPLTIAIVKVLV
ncbi:MAG: AEC family transporter [Armatimonadetes bacterium]|nr:AEC family transporter [Armatimonadota bacterium]MDW8122738.1 AEC family transporter [Armatimonadota bacterium]